MQTFLPEPSFSAVASILDDKRLYKQLLEARQILEILFTEPRKDGSIIPWSHHPAVLMWKGYEYHLWLYFKRIREECIERGIDVVKNTNAIEKLVPRILDLSQDEPVWWSDEKLKDRVIITHRARLFIKKPGHYVHYEQWVEPAKELVCCPQRCNYYWPTHITMKKVGRHYVYK